MRCLVWAIALRNVKWPLDVYQVEGLVYRPIPDSF